MASPFEVATRAAIEEVIANHAKRSKFGYLLSDESFKDLASELYEFVVTSRNLKAAGDRMLGVGPQRPAAASTLPYRPGSR